MTKKENKESKENKIMEDSDWKNLEDHWAKEYEKDYIPRK